MLEIEKESGRDRKSVHLESSQFERRTRKYWVAFRSGKEAVGHSLLYCRSDSVQSPSQTLRPP